MLLFWGRTMVDLDQPLQFDAWIALTRFLATLKKDGKVRSYCRSIHTTMGDKLMGYLSMFLGCYNVTSAM